MDYSNVKKQVGDVWIDGDGHKIPIAYVSKIQKTEDKKVYAIFNILRKSYEYLRKQKEDVVKHAKDMIATYYKENNLSQEQDSFTFYSFDKVLQLEIDSSKPLEYDTNLISQASTHFKNYLDLNTDKIEKALKALIEDLLLNVQKNRMHVGTVKKLERTGSAIDHPEMQEAVKLIRKAQGRGLTKVYYRVRILSPDTGKYELLDVNFSSINIE